MADLDDPNQTSFSIPFQGNEENSIGVEAPSFRPFQYKCDLLDGEKLRIEAYRAAWRKSLDHIKSILHALHAPIASKVLYSVHTSYSRILPGLPYLEVPTICITDQTSNSTFLDQIAEVLDTVDLDDADSTNTASFTSHLYPSDCINLTSAMKALIAGFVERPHILERGSKLEKGRSAVSLVNYDIEILVAWYTAVRDSYEITAEHEPKLVIVLHEFEQLDPLVLQDIFTISSLFVSRLPLVFILSLSSPPFTSFLDATYPRSILALLRVSNVVVPSGLKVLEEVILRTYFSLEFEPDIIIGPGALSYLIDYYTRHDSSIDAVLNILQSTPSQMLSGDASIPFLEELSARLHLFYPNDTQWSKQPIESLVGLTDDARKSLSTRARRLRLGFHIIKILQDFMTSQGYKGISWWNDINGNGIVDAIIVALRGELGPDIKYLGTMVKKLRPSQLAALFDAMHSFFNALPVHVRSAEEEARTTLVLAINTVTVGNDDVTGMGTNFAVWLVNELLMPLETVPLWDLWYTGTTPFVSNLINPSIRGTIVTGLLHPHDFVGTQASSDGPSIWELPDTSILFHRYLDSGKLLNVYDWFTAFKQDLETQRENLLETRRLAKSKSNTKSPRKRGKGKTKEINVESEESLEQWEMQVQARFIRALQELDYLGFLKHTGRKVDHVQRVVFDMRD
ncbi:hypothetical protein H0H93_014231 [Arthromyces matolae]|nr:hypothetical protein H0H93_014231 [Arthromyces matolae]